ncbi:MAG: hypothetical protein LW688_12860 [Cryomorphaceae bacterium]|nr:hypothetical protein [Cryomorphaceae bacterium]
MAVSLTNERDLNRNKMAEEKEVNENDQQKETHEQETVSCDFMLNSTITENAQTRKK